jgi:hypothetical protein
MTTDLLKLEICSGRLMVIATRNDTHSKWNARLYVDQGRNATLQARKFVTEKGVRNWAKSCFDLFLRELAR